MKKQKKYDVVRGDTFMYEGGWIFIMAVADGYCMVRRKGKSPFILTEKEVAGY